jgi:hypothetical protein
LRHDGAFDFAPSASLPLPVLPADGHVNRFSALYFGKYEGVPVIPAVKPAIHGAGSESFSGI